MFVQQSVKYKKLRKNFQYCTQHRTIATTDGSDDTVEDAISSIKCLKSLFSGFLIIRVTVTEKCLITNTNQPYLSRKLIYSKERLLQIIKSQNRLETRACENFHLNLLLLNSKLMDVTFLH